MPPDPHADLICLHPIAVFGIMVVSAIFGALCFALWLVREDLLKQILENIPKKREEENEGKD